MSDHDELEDAVSEDSLEEKETDLPEEEGDDAIVTPALDPEEEF